ncbi:MAG: sulfatase-like hydrolase/transferase, partial [bacterium]|nr:sulfatase-like hydrolase/transferase [bacterium]
MDVWREYSHTFGPKDTGKDAAFDTWMQQVPHWVATEPNPFPVEAQYPSRIVSDFIEWLETREADRPYLAWVSFPEPHSSYQVPEPYFNMFPLEQIPAPAIGKEALEHKNYQWRHQYETIQSFHPELDDVWPHYRTNYCGMLRLIDDQLQRLFSTLEDRGDLDNTIVVFVSDHGELCGDHGLYRKGLALPECSIRIPMILWGVGVVPASQKECYVSCVDIYPTICEFLSLPIPFGVQGRS